MGTPKRASRYPGLGFQRRVRQFLSSSHAIASCALPALRSYQERNTNGFTPIPVFSESKKSIDCQAVVKPIAV